jgi:hypothetical protein
VLFAFATTHFLNHALGLINIELMHGCSSGDGSSRARGRARSCC